MKLLEIYWQMFGYPELPPKDFVVKPIERDYDGTYYMPKSYQVAEEYLSGTPVEELAEKYKITRERVRQLLWKAYKELV